jgi:hypothetical protein
VLSVVRERSSDLDGRIDLRETTTSTYDAVGNLLTIVYEYDWDGDGEATADFLETTANTYDDASNLLTIVYESSFGGRVERRDTTTNTYDPTGNLLTTVYEYYWHSYRGNTASWRTTTTNTYDMAGNLIASIEELDSDGNGTIDSRSTTTNTYDAAGNLIAVLVESDNDGNNTVDYRSTTSSTYDAAGNLISESFEADGYWPPGYGNYVLADGIVDTRRTTSNTYDAAGNLITYVDEIGNYGFVSRRYQSTIVSDNKRRLISSVERSSTYEIAKGSSSETTTTNTYDANDNLINVSSETSLRYYSIGMGSQTNSHYAYTYTYGPLFNADAGFIDLTHFVGVAEVEFTLARDAGNDNFVGFYPITDTNGGIDTNDDTFADLYPGDSGYTEAVLANYQTDLALVVADGEQANIFHQFEGPALYAPFMIAAGMPNDPDSFSLSEVYFPFVVANADGVEHIKYEDGRLLFEDWLGGGDFDYNDAVLQIRFLADKTSAPARSDRFDRHDQHTIHPQSRSR